MEVYAIYIAFLLYNIRYKKQQLWGHFVERIRSWFHLTNDDIQYNSTNCCSSKIFSGFDAGMLFLLCYRETRFGIKGVIPNFLAHVSHFLKTPLNSWRRFCLKYPTIVLIRKIICCPNIFSSTILIKSSFTVPGIDKLNVLLAKLFLNSFEVLFPT